MITHLILITPFALTCLGLLVLANLQMPLSNSKGWEVNVRDDWDVLGPFPLAAREQHFISPSFPLVDLKAPYDHNGDATFPSSLADGGYVGWSKLISSEAGELNVQFPSIRWESLRATEGWAALQHHVLLRSTFTVYPAQGSHSLNAVLPKLLIDLRQGSFFSILPTEGLVDQHNLYPKWHAGNIYEVPGPSKAVISLPGLSTTKPITYDIFISGDYEIRLFGDPTARNQSVPTLSVKLSLELELPIEPITFESSQNLLPDFVDGWAFGPTLAIGVRSVHGSWTLDYVEGDNEGLSFGLEHLYTLVEAQSRAISLKILQTLPILERTINVRLGFKALGDQAPGDVSIIEASLLVQHCKMSDALDGQAILGSHYLTGPLNYLAVPPKYPNSEHSYPPIILLHGAGVDIVNNRLWGEALPQQPYSWIIYPTGRGPWGYDWRGPSALSVWHALDALTSITSSLSSWRKYRIDPDTKVIVMGHSNGGQGAWYLASHFPDKVVAVIPAAGYVKAQLYIATMQSRISHFIDPSLKGILDASLLPDDNDLFLSNLVDTPILALHGGDDENVPTWHSRAIVSIIKSWKANASVSYAEIPHMPHWWPDVFKSPEVQLFLDRALNQSKVQKGEELCFTLSTAAGNAASMHGFRIRSTIVKGRLARLGVVKRNNALVLTSTNVEQLSIPVSIVTKDLEIFVDDQQLLINTTVQDQSTVVLKRNKLGQWTLLKEPIPVRDVGRVADILNSKATFTLVYDDRDSQPLSVALRIARVLALYLGLDAELISLREFLERTRGRRTVSGNVVSIGKGSMSILCEEPSSTNSGLIIDSNGLSIHGRRYNAPSTGALITCTYPYSKSEKVLHVWGLDDPGLERAALLFPFRTGLASPEWIVLDGRSGHVAAAGFWGPEWLSWNDPMSWLG